MKNSPALYWGGGDQKYYEADQLYLSARKKCIFITADNMSYLQEQCRIPKDDEHKQLNWTGSQNQREIIFFLALEQRHTIFSYTANIFQNYSFSPFLCCFKDKGQHKCMTSNIKEMVTVNNHSSMYPPYQHHAQNVYTEQMTQEEKNLELVGSMPRKHPQTDYSVSSFQRSLAT